jgi:hypothetical protein
MHVLAYGPLLSFNESTLTATHHPTLSGGWQPCVLMASDTAGKHYFEVSRLTGYYLKAGVYLPGSLLTTNFWLIDDFRGGCVASPGGGVASAAYSSTGIVRLMVAYDLDAGKIWFGVDGTWVNSGNPVAGTSPIYSNLSGYRCYPGLEIFTSGSAQFHIASGDWLYAPSGFSAPTEFESQAVIVRPKVIDVVDGGNLSVIEPITRLNAVPPQPRRVRLLDSVSGRIVREQWSDPVTGLVDFQNLREGPWDLYAKDHTFEFEAVAVSDRLATTDGTRP